MPETKRVLVERRGRATVLTLNRPEVHNCIDGPTAAALSHAIDEFAADGDARVLVVTGAGEDAFCTGADLKGTGSLAAHPHMERDGPLRFSRLDPGKPTIAAVNGYCFAGGLELACWCDFRIASESAEFGALNRRWGVPFLDGGTQQFPRAVGLGNALWLIESGVRIDARRALEIGLVQEVVPSGRALDRALELAERIAAYPQSSVRADRAAARAALGLPFAQGFPLEAELGMPTLFDPEMRAGLERFASGDRPESPRPA
ncbi:MAG: enoyl-CoA hydratase/isomerase family protein [Acidobacteria bacterium]|nr:enoyl-CoA hydratase/isomerase family protein [Acidobacteriota bacterium]